MLTNPRTGEMFTLRDKASIQASSLREQVEYLERKINGLQGDIIQIKSGFMSLENMHEAIFENDNNL